MKILAGVKAIITLILIEWQRKTLLIILTKKFHKWKLFTKFVRINESKIIPSRNS